MDDCVHCGEILDGFGQCWNCDTYPPERKAKVKPKPEIKRCTTCNAMHSEAGNRCEPCEMYDITPEDYENWLSESN